MKKGYAISSKGRSSQKRRTDGAVFLRKAIERYKLALYNTLVKKGKNSEKAYECLKISWLYRGWIEELSKAEKKDEKTLAECRKEEATYYEQAYEGFLKSDCIRKFPQCAEWKKVP